MSSNTAVVHKHYPERGGAEVVADELARTFDAPVFTAFDEDASSDDVDVHELFGDSVLRLLFSESVPGNWLVRDAYYQFGWTHLPVLEEFDTLIESGNAPMWYVPRDDQTVVRYIHSTPRTAYDRFQELGVSKLVQLYSKAARLLLQPTLPYAELYVANSDLVAHRLRKYWGIRPDDIRVVYPPVDVKQYTPVEGSDYYVALSRLDENKGWLEIVDAFTRTPERELRIIGDGQLRGELEQVAEGYSNIVFEGYVSEARKVELLEEARAGIYCAANEDFGIVPVEYLAAGTPVIAIEDGFTQYQVEDGSTGVTFERGPTVEETGWNLCRALDRFERDSVEADPEDLARIARAFNVDRFRQEMREAVQEAEQRSVIEPTFRTGTSQALSTEETQTEPDLAFVDGGRE